MTFERAISPTWLRRAGLPVIAVLFGLVCVGVLSGTARAHEVSGTEFDAPLPLGPLLAGSGATVALTAAWLAAAESAPAPRTSTRRFLAVSAARWSRLRAIGAVLFTGGFLGIIAAGLVGRQVPNENFATVFTWGVWIHGLGFVAIVVGSPWSAIAPWRLVYRGLAALEGREIALYPSSRIPDAAWPALVGFLVLVGIVENLTVVPRSPRLTVVVISVYAFAMLAGSILFGRSWFQRADPLEVLYELLGRVSPITVSRGEDAVALSFRTPWEAATRPVADLSIVAFVVAMVYTVSFDGFVETRSFQSVLFAVRDSLGIGAGASLLLYLVGFCAFVTVFLVACWGCERLVTGKGDWRSPAERFAPTVIPIAAAYEVAHNYPFVIRSAGQAVTSAIRLLSPDREPINPLWWLSLPQFWASQVVLIVVGHVVAVVAAHHVAVDRYGSNADVGHLPMVAVMVGYTVLSLWIISRPVIS